MENTNEMHEMDAPVPAVEDAVAQVEETEDGEQEELAVAETDCDATMSLLKRFPKVCSRIAEIMSKHAEEVAIELLHKGLDFDNAVANADKEGYLRGRNEKIDLVKGHRMPQLDETVDSGETESESRGLFPRYGKKSVWD